MIGGHQNKETKITKRAGEVWRREETNGPSDNSLQIQFNFSSKAYVGRPSSSRPLDPLNKKILEEHVLNSRSTEGHPRVEREAYHSGVPPIQATGREDVTMVDITDEDQEEEAAIAFQRFPC